MLVCAQLSESMRLQSVTVLRPSLGRSLVAVGLSIGIAIFTVIVGLAVALGMGLPLASMAILLATVIFVLARYGFATYKIGANGPFWTAMILSLVLSVLSLAAPFKVSGVMEVWLICMAPLIVWSSSDALRHARLLRWIAVLFALSMLLGIASTLISEHLRLKAAAYQFAYNLKWPLMLLLGFRVAWQAEDHARLRKLIWLYIGVVLAFLALDAGVPSVYQSLGRNLTEYHHIRNPLIGDFYWRVSGPFIHSSVLAYYCTFFLVILTVQRAGKLTGNAFTALTMGSLLMLSVASGQQQEALAVIVGCVIVWTAFRARNFVHLALQLGILALIVLPLVFWVSGTERFQILKENLGFAPGVRALDSARPVLYADSIRLASEYWPFGAGLGTFGGTGAQLYNRDVYEALGYSRFWWYRQDIFLLDTYWPNFLAELGWIGFACLLSVALLANIYPLWRITRSEQPILKVVWGYAFAGQFVPLIISITSPIYSDTNYAAFALMMLGMAHVFERRLVAAGSAEPMIRRWPRPIPVPPLRGQGRA